MYLGNFFIHKWLFIIIFLPFWGKKFIFNNFTEEDCSKYFIKVKHKVISNSTRQVYNGALFVWFYYERKKTYCVVCTENRFLFLMIYSQYFFISLLFCQTCECSYGYMSQSTQKVLLKNSGMLRDVCIHSIFLEKKYIFNKVFFLIWCILCPFIYVLVEIH